MLDELFCECPATGQLLGDTIFLSAAVRLMPCSGPVVQATLREPSTQPVLLTPCGRNGWALMMDLSVLSMLRNGRGISMAVAAFSTVNDGLEPSPKDRGHYIVDANLEDSGPGIPYAERVRVQLCRFNVTTGGVTVVLNGLPGVKLGVHYHAGTVHGFTLRGQWTYLEHDWIAKPGTSSSCHQAGRPARF